MHRLALQQVPNLLKQVADSDPVHQIPKELRDQLTPIVCNTLVAACLRVVLDEIGPYLDSLQQNLERIYALGTASEKIGSAAGEDVLRASIVLLHATLEDFLRTLAMNLLPKANEETLNEISLVGLKGRPKNFGLGKLVHHKGKTVEDVLRESVREHLERSNYNSTSEIANLLEILGFDVSSLNEPFAELEQMIQRRHQIVHRADRTKSPDSDAFIVQPINPQDVVRWVGAVCRFIGSTLPDVFLRAVTKEKLIIAVQDAIRADTN